MSPSTHVPPVMSQRPSRAYFCIRANSSGCVAWMAMYAPGWLWLNLNSGNSSMKLQAWVHVRTHTSWVSGHSHSQFMSMWAWPMR